jgi:hypothetical protein
MQRPIADDVALLGTLQIDRQLQALSDHRLDRRGIRRIDDGFLLAHFAQHGVRRTWRATAKPELIQPGTFTHDHVESKRRNLSV